jgi:hypothetical protein
MEEKMGGIRIMWLVEIHISAGALSVLDQRVKALPVYRDQFQPQRPRRACLASTYQPPFGYAVSSKAKLLVTGNKDISDLKELLVHEKGKKGTSHVEQYGKICCNWLHRLPGCDQDAT